MFMIISVLLVVSLAFVMGCAKKAAVKETSEQQAVAEKKAQADAEKAAREKSLKEAELREQERQKAERERAEKSKAAAEAAAVSPLSGFEFIYFDYDKYAVTPDARNTLKKVADWLGAHPEAKVLIEGNCDERGTVEYNLALGERRADAAMKYLVSLGVDKSRLSTVSYGKERPVDPGHDEAAWAKNRNDHFVVK